MTLRGISLEELDWHRTQNVIYALMVRDMREERGIPLRDSIDAAIMGEPMPEDAPIMPVGPTEADPETWGTSSTAVAGKKALDALIPRMGR